MAVDLTEFAVIETPFPNGEVKESTVHFRTVDSNDKSSCPKRMSVYEYCRRIRDGTLIDKNLAGLNEALKRYGFTPIDLN